MIREDSPYRLLVEGRDDQHSVIHLMKRHGIDWDNPGVTLPCVYDCQGFPLLRASLSVSAKSYERLGIMVDANADLLQRWIQVKDNLAQAGVILPTSPDPAGVAGKPRPAVRNGHHRQILRRRIARSPEIRRVVQAIVLLNPLPQSIIASPYQLKQPPTCEEAKGSGRDYLHVPQRY